MCVCVFIFVVCAGFVVCSLGFFLLLFLVLSDCLLRSLLLSFFLVLAHCFSLMSSMVVTLTIVDIGNCVFPDI